MKKILNSKYGLLIFSLICGLAYFCLVMLLISQIKYSYLLGIFFFPTIICGAAVCIFKTVRGLSESNETKKIKNIFAIHYALIVFTVIALIFELLAKIY